MAQLERNSISEVNLLVWSERIIEELGMVKVLLKFGSPRTLFNALEVLRVPGRVSGMALQFTCTTYSIYPPFSAGIPIFARLGQ